MLKTIFGQQVKFRKNPNYVFRLADPKRDLDLKGQPVPMNKKSIVRLLDVGMYSRMNDGNGGITVICNPKRGKAVFVNHENGFAVGQIKKASFVAPREVEGELTHVYFQRTVFMVKGNDVYTGSLYLKRTDENKEVFESEKKFLAKHLRK